MSDIKECFISRWEEGVILESDFSQLEVVGLAALSRDGNLIEDLLSGRDMHTYFTAQRLGIEEKDVTPKERKFTKKMTFQLQYGSGAANMARKLGLAVDACKTFISTYYERYWEVKNWQELVIAEVEASREATDRLTEKGLPQGKGVWVGPMGRKYTFYEQDPKEWMRDQGVATFSPTQMKNYPVQGSATADIMAVFRARLYRRLLSSPLRGRVLLINTVHDSIMADCMTREDALQLAVLIKEIADSLVDVLAETWGFICPVPFKIETKIGSRWSELEKI